jgi:hypothetical protein
MDDPHALHAQHVAGAQDGQVVFVVCDIFKDKQDAVDPGAQDLGNSLLYGVAVLLLVALLLRFLLRRFLLLLRTLR